MNIYERTAFTMIEFIIAVALLTVALASALAIFNYSIGLTEFSSNSTIGLYEAQFRMEHVRSQDYGTVWVNYTNNGMLMETPFNLQLTTLQGGLDGVGTIYAEELVVDDLIRIKVVVSWRQRGRIIGEDINLNGRLDIGEDTNGNSELDSPCEMESVVVNIAE